MFNRILSLISILLIFFAFATERFITKCYAQGTVYQAASANLSDVSAAVSKANRGDTIVVPVGSVTWNGSLSLNKGIILKGAGIDNTVIKNGTASFLINYQPASGSWSLNMPLRISGFTFDLNNQTDGGAINLNQAYGVEIASQTLVQSNIRIDHNRFMNSSDIKAQAIRNWGMRGVVDNNIIDNVAYPIRADQGTSQKWWDSWGPLSFGKAEDNMFFEDNTINNVPHFIADCQIGGRYSFRYNAISLIPKVGNEGYHQMFDMHGNQGGSLWSCFGGEMYGNKVNNGNIGSVQFLDQRGGKVMVFNNYFFNAPGMYIQLRDEYDDSINPTVNQPQHVTESYYWNNIRSGGSTATALIPINIQQVVSGHPSENSDFYKQQPAAFNGTSGVGVGTEESRPATCTPGVGYWATTQSTSILSTMVGPNPPTAIQGKLYKCTSANIWTLYYTPLEYPHPLRVRGPLSDSASSSQPMPPSNLIVQ